ncbi:MAG: hypothetical protein CMF62_00720 [Magnetococcales bacterium]|nr:hypothetical protein [Magnetococcales bacterium]|tara:strand:- start:34424 stop:35659 length:1236 start_codon:yes stop_codon:yes gene_type:complete
MLKTIPENKSIDTIELRTFNSFSNETKNLVHDRGDDNYEFKFTPLYFLNLLQRHFLPFIAIVLFNHFIREETRWAVSIVSSIIYSIVSLVIWNKCFRNYQNKQTNDIFRKFRVTYSLSHLFFSSLYYICLFLDILPYSSLVSYLIFVFVPCFLIGEIRINYLMRELDDYHSSLFTVTNYMIPLTTAIIGGLEIAHRINSNETNKDLHQYIALFVVFKIVELVLHHISSYHIRWKMLLCNIIASAISYIAISQFKLNGVPDIMKYMLFYLNSYSILCTTGLYTVKYKKEAIKLLIKIFILNGFVNYFLTGIYYSTSFDSLEGIYTAVGWYFVFSLILPVILKKITSISHGSVKYYYKNLSPLGVPIVHSIYVILLIIGIIPTSSKPLLQLFIFNISNVVFFNFLPMIFNLCF